jgi:two-component system, NtrC family, response regulator AtoC
MIERTVLLADGPVLTPDMLPARVAGREPSPEPAVNLGAEGLDFEALEQSLLEAALRRAEGNRTEAGRLLGMSRHQVRNRLKKYGLEE